MKSWTTLLALVSVVAASPLFTIGGTQHSISDYNNYEGFEGYNLNDLRLVQLDDGAPPVWMTELEKVRTIGNTCRANTELNYRMKIDAKSRGLNFFDMYASPPLSLYFPGTTGCYQYLY
jgi:hypothetical protein